MEPMREKKTIIIMTCYYPYTFRAGADLRILGGGVIHLMYWGLTPQQQPGSYQGGEIRMMKSVFWWRKPEYPEETTDLGQVTDETFHTYGLGSGSEFFRGGGVRVQVRRNFHIGLLTSKTNSEGGELLPPPR